MVGDFDHLEGGRERESGRDGVGRRKRGESKGESVENTQ